MIYIWGLVAGGLAVACETVFKSVSSYTDYLWFTVPAALIINYAVFNMVQLSPSLPSAFIVFGMTTMLCRVMVSVYLQHPIGTLTWLAIALYFMALLLRELERHI